MGKVIFFDIDGTLTSAKSNLVYDSTIETLKKLEANGHIVALATGRAHFRAQMFAESIGIKNMICEGGNCVCINNEIVDFEYSDQDVVHEVLKEAEAKGIPYAISVDDTPVRISPDDSFDKKTGDFSQFMQVKVVEGMNFRNYRNIRRFFLALTLEEEKEMESIKKIGMMRYQDDFIIVEPDDKYKGIRKMVQLLNADENEVVVFGDGLNDRKMFKDAPFAIAMGNAIDELKALADYVTAESDDDGIMKACQHFGWID